MVRPVRGSVLSMARRRARFSLKSLARRCRMYSSSGISMAEPISTAYCVAQLSGSTPALRSAGKG
ncbi:hypothetical protein D9M69_653150 [compost metagenome]